MTRKIAKFRAAAAHNIDKRHANTMYDERRVIPKQIGLPRNKSFRVKVMHCQHKPQAVYFQRPKPVYFRGNSCLPPIYVIVSCQNSVALA